MYDTHSPTPCIHVHDQCSGLKSLITPVLAGLLESDITKMLSFETFFATIETISKMRVSEYQFSDSRLLVMLLKCAYDIVVIFGSSYGPVNTYTTTVHMLY